MLSVLPISASRDMVEAGAVGGACSCECAPSGQVFGSSPIMTLWSTATETVYWANRDCVQTLPLDVLVEVFKNLDTVSLGRASQVCRRWDIAARTDSLWDPKCDFVVSSCHMIASSLEARIPPLKTHYTQIATTERLDFLLATVSLMKKYFALQLRKRSWTTQPDTKFSCHLLHCICKQLYQTNEMVQLLEGGKFKITINFDIFELTLRRYYEELRVMVPIPVERIVSTTYGIENNSTTLAEDPRLDVLTDPISRALWKENIGKECHCHFDTFYDKLILATFPAVADNARFRGHLCHYLNFPTDNLLTVYRFHVLVSVFGPVHNIAKNFETYVLGKGFLGLINMIKAEEILRKEHPTVNTVLVRFSRQKPTQLAFTSWNQKNRTMEHRRNVDKAGHSIPIATYLKEQFPNYNLIQLGVDDEKSSLVAIPVRNCASLSSLTEMSTKVFVGNLSFRTREPDLSHEFESVVARVVSVNIISRGPRSLGYGFVEFETEDDAKKAVSIMNQRVIDGRPINVELARFRDPMAPTVPRQPRMGAGRRRFFNAMYPQMYQQPQQVQQMQPMQSMPPQQTQPQTQQQPQFQQFQQQQFQQQQYPQMMMPMMMPMRGMYGGFGGMYGGMPMMWRQPQQRNSTRRTVGARVPSKTTLFVGNLPFVVEDANLREIFQDYNVKEARVSRHPSGTSKGYGFVELASEEDQHNALGGLTKVEVDGRTVIIKPALSEPFKQPAVIGEPPKDPATEAH